MTELHTDHLSVGERLEHTRYQQLREFDHRPEYQSIRLVPSESSESVYLVATVECLAEPFGPDTDASEDRISVGLCSCSDHYYRGTGGFEDSENPPEEWDECKHFYP